MTAHLTPRAELDAALAAPPGELAFRAAVSVLDTWTGPGRDTAAAAATATLDTWPDDCRVAPWTWVAAALAGEPGANWALARSLRTTSGRIGCTRFRAGPLAAAGLGTHVTRIALDPYAFLDKVNEAGTFTEAADRWPSLRHVSGLRPTDDGAVPFLQSEIIARLESLEYFLPDHPRRANPAPGFGRTAERLWRLDLRLPSSPTDVRPMLAADRLPALRELGLKGQFFTGPTPASLVGIAVLPVIGQIDILRLDELPEDLVTAILARSDLRLERLELRNRPYQPPYLNAEQQQACRLTPAGVAAIARSADLSALTRLVVAHNRINDAVLDLVAATSPGRLEELELVDVGLTDAGAARLAALPQLAGVTRLDLRGNSLTGAGVATLTASPHLASLRHLDLGGGRPNPYYGAGDGPQPIGDRGADALAAAGLTGQLERLGLRATGLGPDGVAALGRSPTSRLRAIDLSHNALGRAGVQGLAVSPLAAGLQELDLSVCGLDDEAVAELVRADLGRLRDLRLGYNSIGPAGAAALAAAATLASLWKLDLRDNFVGDDGLTALAGSPHLVRLVELDLEQDVWNYRSAQFGPDVARAVAGSAALARLDTFFAGIIDEYHGSRYRRPFPVSGYAAMRASTTLRPPVRHGLAAIDDVPDEDEPLEYAYHHDTPRETEQSRREHDFRGLPPLPAEMAPGEWQTTPDPDWMLEVAGPEASPRKLRLFACACARRALALADLPSALAVVEMGERMADGQATPAECEEADQVLQESLADCDQESVETYIGTAVSNTVRDEAAEGAEYAAQTAVQATVARSLRDAPRTLRGNSYLPEHRAQADLLRCLFGPSPVDRPTPLDPAWRTSTVEALARGIYDDRAFDRLPILADAMEEAGCCDAAVLAHLRGSGPHARGCWVVDLVLGKE
jgi:Ran GTPase-activating protein (RanGAP) involved in mRNA processing and transport